MHGRFFLSLFIFAALLAGCFEPTAIVEQPEPEVALAQNFDDKATGTIRGQVVWEGAVPVSEEHLVRTIAYNPSLPKNPARFVLPHVPKVHPVSRGVENAVVFLRGIDPARLRAWDHPKVSIEFHERKLLVKQGAHVSGVGFVRRGSGIEIVNRDTEYHILRGRGTTFFAMPLVNANESRERKLTQTGLVDLTCAAGYYWLHAHLFVAEHPYYARTDADGRFALDQVPAGDYELVCWLPSWRVERKEVDPETAIISRLVWQTPKEQSATVRVVAGRASEASFGASARLFE